MEAGAGPLHHRVAHKGLLARGAASPLFCPGSANRAPAQESPRACGLTWTPAPLLLPPPPPQPDGELGPWNCLREERGDAERRGWRWPQVQDPLPTGTSTGPTRSLPAWGAAGAQPSWRLGPCTPSPCPRPAQPLPHSHLRGLYLFISPSSAESPGPGRALGLY